jgi:hypothetical protein
VLQKCRTQCQTGSSSVTKVSHSVSDIYGSARNSFFFIFDSLTNPLPSSCCATNVLCEFRFCNIHASFVWFRKEPISWFSIPQRTHYLIFGPAHIGSRRILPGDDQPFYKRIYKSMIVWRYWKLLEAAHVFYQLCLTVMPACSRIVRDGNARDCSELSFYINHAICNKTTR